MDIVEKIKYLAKKNNTDMANIEKTLGLGNSSIRRWNTNSPSCAKVLKVADYLSVTVDWLIRDELEIPDLEKANFPFSNKLNTLLAHASEEDIEKIKNYLEISVLFNTTNKNKIFNNDTSFDLPLLNEESSYNAKSYSVPIRGYVAAGKPIEAIDNVISTIEINNLDVDYALIVNGNSMDPIIKDGEYVFVKSTKELKNNDIGVFYYNGTVTCKKFFKNDVLVKLISLNPTYEDFVFYLDDSKNEYINFIIEGKVVLSPIQQRRLSC